MQRISLLTTALAFGMALATPVFAQEASQPEEAPVAPAAEAAPAPETPASGAPTVLVSALEQGSIVALNQTYRAVGQVFRPTSTVPVDRFAFMVEIYDGSVSVIGKILEWDETAGGGSEIWNSGDMVELTNSTLKAVVFETGGISLDPAKQYALLLQVAMMDSEKGAGVGASMPGTYADGYMVRQELEGYDVLEPVDATFIVLANASPAADAPASTDETPSADAPAG